MPIFSQENVHSQKTHCSQVHILSKYVQSLKNTALMSFFQNFHEKLSAVKPIFGQKNVNAVNTTLCYGPNKSIWCPFSWFFTKNNWSHARILSKKRPFFKNHTAIMPIFCQKKPKSLKKYVLSFHIFFQILTEKPPVVIPVFGQKTSILSNYIILWKKKSIRCLFLDFHEKVLLSCPYLVKKMCVL